MTDNIKCSEHNRIEEYLKKRNIKLIKSKTVKKHSNQLSNFPIGLIIITNEDSEEYKLKFINQYACRLFKIKENSDISILKQKFDEYIKLKNDYNTKTSHSLNEIIFNSTSFNLDIDNFVPFENKHSKTSILYIKINDIEDEKYIVIDKYDKYLDEKKYIELNLIKNINYQYLHTLYHELNNPLNALIALSGDNYRFDKSELGESKIDDKSSNSPRKIFNSRTRKVRNSSILSLNPSQKKIFNQDLKEDNKSRKKSLGLNINWGLDSKIPLLVNIIKVFIKNFILYLKIRADNLLSLKNEYELQNEASDIMNAVEISDYEKQLTKHKEVKINLEYILDLYFQKYLCLFQYKEIEYETKFEKLKNMYITTDEFNFSYYIRQIYTYLYYVVPKREKFFFEYIEEENNNLKIMIKKKPYKVQTRRSEININPVFKEDENIFKMDEAIQTKEMTKEVLYSMSKKLKFNIEIFDCENVEQNNYLFITIPFEKNKNTEFDDFEDDDINEMVGKHTVFLEEKLKRQFPNNSLFEVHKASNISTLQLMDMLNKSGEENKISGDSLNSLNKTNNGNNNLKNTYKNLDISPKNFENINLVNNSNKLSPIKEDSFLNKCLKVNEKKKFEKSKFKLTENEINSSNGKEKDENKSKLKSASSIKTINKSEKNDKSEKSKKSNEILNLMKNNGKDDKSDILPKTMSEYPIEIDKNKKDEITFKDQSNIVSGFGSSIKAKIINENKQNSIGFNNELIGTGTVNLSSVKTGHFGMINSKMKSSCFASEINAGGKDDDKSKNLEGDGLVLIELEKERKNFNLQKGMNQNISNKLILHPIKEENDKGTQTLQNKTSDCNNNRNTTNSQNEKNDSLQKDNYIKTVFDNDINDNQTLFLKAINESKNHKKKLKKNKNKFINFSQSSENNSNLENESKEEEDNNSFHSDEQCNCADLLVVDDEEFNVMASQRMLQNLGYDSDAAYNGEECINLINEKLKINCKCERSYYKIIFLDIVMPIMDGIKAAKKIQEMIDKKIINDKTKIIFISGNLDDSNLKNSLLEINCVKECLQKPVRIEKYEKIIEKYYD